MLFVSKIYNFLWVGGIKGGLFRIGVSKPVSVDRLRVNWTPRYFNIVCIIYLACALVLYIIRNNDPSKGKVWKKGRTLTSRLCFVVARYGPKSFPTRFTFRKIYRAKCVFDKYYFIWNESYSFCEMFKSFFKNRTLEFIVNSFLKCWVFFNENRNDFILLVKYKIFLIIKILW